MIYTISYIVLVIYDILVIYYKITIYYCIINYDIIICNFRPMFCRTNQIRIKTFPFYYIDCM